MNWMQFIGSACFGILVGGLVTYCIISAREFYLKILGGVVGVVAGGIVLRLFIFNQSGNSLLNAWILWYFVGLLAGGVMISLPIGNTPDINGGPPDGPKPPNSN